MNNIKQFDVYIERMKKSYADKMFFLDKISDSVNTILDFGCADGSMIKIMQDNYTRYNYIGYDISDKMISIARKLVPNASFYTNWDEININFENSLLNLSSVIHEIYSYGDESSVNEFWKHVWNSNFKYIAIRDMMTDQNSNKFASEENIALLKRKYPNQVADYENVWGNIKSNKDIDSLFTEI